MVAIAMPSSRECLYSTSVFRDLSLGKVVPALERLRSRLANSKLSVSSFNFSLDVAETSSGPAAAA